MDAEHIQKVVDRPDFDRDQVSCSIYKPKNMLDEPPEMKKKSSNASKKGKVSASENTKNAVITAQDVQIMQIIGLGRSTTSDINNKLLEQADAQHSHLTIKNTLGNTFHKLTRMADKGFLFNVHRDDKWRHGLRDGEQRRFWKVTPLGRQAIALRQKMMDVQSDPKIPKTQSLRNLKPKRKKRSKKKISKKVATKKKKASS